jgi:hypothetical protein
MAMRSAVIAFSAILAVRGEVFKFEARPLPEGYSLQGLAAFTIYAGADSPVKANTGDMPFVEYRDVQAHSLDSSQSDSALGSYKSLELTMIRQEDYAEHIEKGPICNANDQLHTAGATSVKMHGVHFTNSERQEVKLDKTGTYFLLMSNCGNFSKGVINGAVAVRNPYGYVSGIDYHKMVAYGWLVAAYAVMAAVWVVLLLVWKSELIAMHAVISIVLGMGMLESCCWYLHLTSLNQTGVTTDSVVCVLVMLSVLTEYTSYTFILVVSQGWRMTEEVLDDCLLAKMGFFGLFWVVANYLRQGAMTHRSAYHISTKFMTLTAIPSMLVNLCIFAWVFMSLGTLTKNLKERGLDDQLKAISRFTTGLIVAIIVGTLVALIQMMDSAGSLKLDWKYQFVMDNGINHVIFICMVALSMIVWMPSAGTGQMGYAAPEEQLEQEEGIWKEGDEEGGNKVAPQMMGNADEDL